MGWLNNIADKKFEQKGYKLIQCNKNEITWEKYIPEHNYTRVLTIVYKLNKNHVIQCYDKQTIKTEYSNLHYVNSVDSIEISLLFWLWVKYRYVSRKHKWNRKWDFYG